MAEICKVPWFQGTYISGRPTSGVVMVVVVVAVVVVVVVVMVVVVAVVVTTFVRVAVEITKVVL